jgi:beta-N-acetylhexosaminidase
LALNPKNSVIVGLERSYGSSSQEVSNYAKIFVKALESQNIQPVLKHFPGHGSSLGDSHLGFVDVTKTWSQKELEPYQELIDSGDASMIMTAHVFNANLDAKYPATLSYNVNTKLLRQKMGYKGLIVSDDLQMAAIAEHYTLEETVRLAINSGIDILLFGNQLRRNDAKEIIDTIYKEIQNGKISLSNIVESNKRIALLHTKRRIIQKPIDFPQERIQMSKEYIRTHYGLDVKDITIKPKMIVLHWTAVMDLNSSFMRLKPQMLFSDRKDIADAGALNVSAHFLVARDGTIYQLMPDNLMARHVIGLNYSSIGVENVGGKDNIKEDLTPAQVEANIALVRYLKTKYPSIDYLIGHHEYLKMQTNPLWLEKDKNYRTLKNDPGNNFMQAVRKDLTDLQFKEL